MKKPAGIFNQWAFLFLLSNNSSFAGAAEPFLTRNQNPFSLIFGLPHATAARLIATGEQRWISSLNISNQIISQTSNNAHLFVDVETWQLNFFYDYAFQENWMLRVQLPMISHSGGILDNAIDRYHRMTGLPRDIRPGIPENQINISYSENDQLLLNIDKAQQTLRDISMQLAWQASKSAEQSLSHWISLKLPSGDSDRLTGSGSTDLAVWSSLDQHLYNDNWLYGQLGLLYINNSQVLHHMHNNWVAFATGGIKFQPDESIELKAQLDMHSAPFDSQIKYLDSTVLITFGGSYLLSAREKVDFAVSEDIDPGASPDVNFNISWWKYF